MSTLRFSRPERLKSRKVIGQLFEGGKSYVAYPFRVVWCDNPFPASIGAEAGPAQLAISVPKRHFKTAVQRNRLKRQIREAYRLEKAAFYDKLSGASAPPNIALMLMFIAKTPVPYAEIQSGIAKVIRKWPGG